MEMQLKKEPLSYLEPVVCSGRELEQTQQIRLPEGMPDIGKVLGVWGQSVLRSKEWRADGVSVSGGVLVWVLYAPEDGSQPRALDGWIGFQGKWDLPEGSPDGTVLVQPIVRTLDARSVSPRKLLVRAGLGISCMALCRREAEYSVAGELPEDVLLRREQRPLRLYAEAGEKGFVLEDNLPLSGEGSGKIVSCTAQCLLTDRKVVGDKLAFRGSTEVHGLFLTEEGMPVSRHFTLPFSQLIQLEKAYGSDGEADISFCITNLETENDAEGQTRLKLGITAQYAISDVTNLELLTDAYSPHREVKLSWDTVDVCAILDRQRGHSSAGGCGQCAGPVWHVGRACLGPDGGRHPPGGFRLRPAALPAGGKPERRIAALAGNLCAPCLGRRKACCNGLPGYAASAESRCRAADRRLRLLPDSSWREGHSSGKRHRAGRAPAKADRQPLSDSAQSRGAGPVDPGENSRLHRGGHPGGQPIGGRTGKGENDSDPGRLMPVDCCG